MKTRRSQPVNINKVKSDPGIIITFPKSINHDSNPVLIPTDNVLQYMKDNKLEEVYFDYCNDPEQRVDQFNKMINTPRSCY
jgi:hypothetical protein